MPRLPDAAWNAYWRIDPRPDGPLEPSHVVLATRAGDRSRLVAAFSKSVHDCLTGPSASELSS
jgi:hypothetical protein